MEHAYGAAIEISAATLKESQDWFNDVSAHEFLHLWNVKRIRPQTLEPVDYTKENLCSCFVVQRGCDKHSPGYILLQAGLLDERRYLQRLGDRITTLQQRSAHKTQSAEESSLNASLEKYAFTTASRTAAFPTTTRVSSLAYCWTSRFAKEVNLRHRCGSFSNG